MDAMEWNLQRQKQKKRQPVASKKIAPISKWMMPDSWGPIMDFLQNWESERKGKEDSSRYDSGLARLPLRKNWRTSAP